MIEDEKKRDKILKLLRFITSNNITGLVSIEDNLGKMKKKLIRELFHVLRDNIRNYCESSILSYRKE